MPYLKSNYPLSRQTASPKTDQRDFEREALASLGGSIVIFHKAKDFLAE